MADVAHEAAAGRPVPGHHDRKDEHMSNLRKATATLGVATMMAVPAATLVASPAGAVDKSERCAGARIELSVERDDGGFEVEADVDDAKPGSKWRVVLRHDGKRFFRDVRKADGDGDISIDRFRPDTAGKDVFRLRVTKLSSGKVCSLSITRR